MTIPQTSRQELKTLLDPEDPKGLEKRTAQVLKNLKDLDHLLKGTEPFSHDGREFKYHDEELKNVHLSQINDQRHEAALGISSVRSGPSKIHHADLVTYYREEEGLDAEKAEARANSHLQWLIGNYIRVMWMWNDLQGRCDMLLHGSRAPFPTSFQSGLEVEKVWDSTVNEARTHIADVHILAKCYPNVADRQSRKECYELLNAGGFKARKAVGHLAAMDAGVTEEIIMDLPEEAGSSAKASAESARQWRQNMGDTLKSLAIDAGKLLEVVKPFGIEQFTCRCEHRTRQQV